MSIDYSKLRGKIIEKLGTYERFAKKMGMSAASVTLRLSGKIGWKQSEIISACELLDIDFQDIPVYFFTLLVQH